MLAKDIMTKNVITIKENDNVEYIAKLLLKYNISGLPVVNDENEVVGIITEADLIYRSKKLKIPTHIELLGSYIFLESFKTIENQIKKMTAYKAKDLMTTDVITVDYEEDIEEIASIMIDKKINRIPVLKEGKLVGIISRKDIIKGYTKK